MKGNAVMWIAIVGVLILVGTYFAGLWGQPGAIIDGCPFVKPLFGRIECEPISSQTQHIQASWAWGQDVGLDQSKRYSCGDDENSPKCDFTVICDGTDATFNYQTNQNPQCYIGSATWCSLEVLDNTETTFLSNQPVGTFVQPGSCTRIFGTIKIGGSAYTRFQPYGLNVYDSGAKFRYNTQSCSLSSFGFGDAGNVITNAGDTNTKPKYSDFLPYDDWVNYLSDWVYAPIDISSKIVTYNGQQSYCLVNAIYEIGQFSTANSCYRLPMDKVADVECCPGMQSAGRVCTDQFTWSDISEPCAVTCPTGSVLECQGQGNWIPDYTTPNYDIIRYGCVTSGASKCCEIAERKDVECQPPDIGCPPGYICNPNSGYTCEPQVGPGIECGDGVCTSPFEDQYTCPQDCAPEPIDWAIIWIPIFAILFGLIGYWAKGILGGVIGGIVGGLIGYVIYWFITLPWWIQIFLGIGGVATGGILAYFLLPVIIIAVGIAIGYASR